MPALDTHTIFVLIRRTGHSEPENSTTTNRPYVCACGAPVGAAAFVVEVVRLNNVGAFWHRHTRGIICVRGSGARLRHALRSRVLLSTSESQASTRFVCDFGWRGMRRARATDDVGKGLGLVVTRQINDGDPT